MAASMSKTEILESLRSMGVEADARQRREYLANILLTKTLENQVNSLEDEQVMSLLKKFSLPSKNKDRRRASLVKFLAKNPNHRSELSQLIEDPAVVPDPQTQPPTRPQNSDIVTDQRATEASEEVTDKRATEASDIVADQRATGASCELETGQDANVTVPQLPRPTEQRAQSVPVRRLSDLTRAELVQILKNNGQTESQCKNSVGQLRVTAALLLFDQGVKDIRDDDVTKILQDLNITYPRHKDKRKGKLKSAFLNSPELQDVILDMLRCHRRETGVRPPNSSGNRAAVSRPQQCRAADLSTSGEDQNVQPGPSRQPNIPGPSRPQQTATKSVSAQPNVPGPSRQPNRPGPSRPRQTATKSVSAQPNVPGLSRPPTAPPTAAPSSLVSIQQKVVRLINHGNSCFNNSVLNGLFSSPAFLSFLNTQLEVQPGKGRLLNELRRLVIVPSGVTARAAEVIRLVAIDSRGDNDDREGHGEDYDDGEQHDPALYLNALIVCLRNELMPISVQQLDEMFCTSMTEELRCTDSLLCPATINPIEYSAPLPLPALNSISVENSCQIFLQTEQRVRTCRACLGTNAHVEKKLAQLPRVLVIQLTRFQIRNKRELVKLKHRIRTAYKLQPQPGGPVYELTGVVVHKGEEAISGHYVSFTRRPNSSQLVIGDDNAEPRLPASHQEQELLHHAFLLFYERKDPIVALPPSVQLTAVQPGPAGDWVQPPTTAPIPTTSAPAAARPDTAPPPSVAAVHTSGEQSAGAGQIGRRSKRSSRVARSTRDTSLPRLVSTKEKRTVTTADIESRTSAERQPQRKRFRLDSDDDSQVQIVHLQQLIFFLSKEEMHLSDVELLTPPYVPIAREQVII